MNQPRRQAIARELPGALISRMTGKELRWAREALGLSCDQLVAQLPSGIGRRALQKYEQGRVNPSLVLFIEICHSLQTDAPSLLWQGLQQTRLFLQNLHKQYVDLQCLLDDSSGKFPLMRQWAQNALNENSGGVVGLLPSSVSQLAMSLGCAHRELAGYLAGFLPDQAARYNEADITGCDDIDVALRWLEKCMQGSNRAAIARGSTSSIQQTDSQIKPTAKLVNRVVGGELQRQREARRWTRLELVEMLPSGIGSPTLQSYEDGNRQLTILRFIELCGALDVAAPTVLARALQGAGIYIEYMPLVIDLHALLRDKTSGFRPLHPWARNLKLQIIEVEPVVVQNLAWFIDCEVEKLRSYLSQFLPEIQQQ